MTGVAQTSWMCMSRRISWRTGPRPLLYFLPRSTSLDAYRIIKAAFASPLLRIFTIFAHSCGCTSHLICSVIHHPLDCGGTQNGGPCCSVFRMSKKVYTTDDFSRWPIGTFRWGQRHTGILTWCRKKVWCWCRRYFSISLMVISDVGDDHYFSTILKKHFDTGIVKFLGHRPRPLRFFTV
jgi:hypothetical protein